MTLILRRQVSEFIPEWDRDKFWDVFHAGISVGVIVVTRGRSDTPPSWGWTIHLHAGRHDNGIHSVLATSGSGSTREEAMSAFRPAFEFYLAYITEAGWARHVEHTAWSTAQAERWRRQRYGSQPGGYG